MLLTVQSLWKVAIHGVAVPSTPTEEGLLSLRVAEPLDFGEGLGMAGKEGTEKVEPILAIISPKLSLSVHRYFQERLETVQVYIQ